MQDKSLKKVNAGNDKRHQNRQCTAVLSTWGTGGKEPKVANPACKRSRSQYNLAPMGRTGQINLIQRVPTPQSTAPKGPADNILGPDTTAHPLRSGGVMVREPELPRWYNGNSKPTVGVYNVNSFDEQIRLNVPYCTIPLTINICLSPFPKCISFLFQMFQLSVYVNELVLK